MTKRKIALAMGALALPAWLSAVDLGNNFSVHGYANFEFEKQWEEKPDVPASDKLDENASFDADSIDLVLQFQPSDRVRAAVDLGLEHGAALGGDAGTGAADARGDIGLEYGFTEYSWGDFAKLRAGKMLTPFGYYNEIHTVKVAQLGVKEPSALNKNKRIVGGGFSAYPRWGAGVALNGDLAVGEQNLAYDLMVANGEHESDLTVGTQPYDKDNNKNKSFTGRVRFGQEGGWLLGVSTYYEDEPTPGYVKTIGSSVELRYEIGALKFLAEGLQGYREKYGASPSNRHTTTEREFGWYVQPSYAFDNGVTLYTRFDHFEPTYDGKGEDWGYDATGGVNWRIEGNYIVKVEHHYLAGGERARLTGSSSGDAGKHYGAHTNETRASIVLGF